MSRILRNSLCASMAGVLMVLSGCGSANHGTLGSVKVTKSQPTAATRAKIKGLITASAQGTALAAFQPESAAMMRNSLSPTSTGAAVAPAPMLGAFLRNVASAPPTKQNSYIVAASARTRQEDSGSTGGSSGSGETVPGFSDTFYYDYYLGLWVQISDTPGVLTYSLYEDEAKTKPAGSIETTLPTDYNTYPQTYKSTYTITAGALAGAHGGYESTVAADYSGESSYNNVYADGSKDKGQGTWSADGTSNWSSRYEQANGAWVENSGSWTVDGVGKYHNASSDGYASDYIYNSDGSGTGTISGPDPGLPATIVWDRYGKTTITYADGTVETIPGWGYIAVPVATPGTVTNSTN